MAFVALVPFFLGWALAEPRLSTRAATPRELPASAILTPPPEDSPAISSPPAPADEAPDPAQSETDLYGNEVSDAVAKYGLDSTGSLYEMHTPQVEVPKLGSPKS